VAGDEHHQVKALRRELRGREVFDLLMNATPEIWVAFPRRADGDHGLVLPDH
jgi:hypothetical protein